MELAAGLMTNQQMNDVIEESNQRKSMNYKNGGITLPQTQFVGPGNNVVDENNKSNFNSLPDNCLDWIALEHDVDYHNVGNTDNRQLYNIENLDNKAIDNAWRECFAKQPIATSVLAAGLKLKQHAEVLAETASWPFGKNNAVYPPSTTNKKEIDWFTKVKSRRRNNTGEHAFSVFRSSSSITS